MARVLLDTSVLIAGERASPGVRAVVSDSDTPAVSTITVHEYRKGIERADTPERRDRRTAALARMLGAAEVLPVDLEVASTGAAVWARLAAGGAMIGALDVLIAATALVHGLPVATLDAEDFRRVEGLRVLEVAPGG